MNSDKHTEAKFTPGPRHQCPGPDYADEKAKSSNGLFIQTKSGSVIAEARRMATFGPVQDTDLALAAITNAFHE